MMDSLESRSNVTKEYFHKLQSWVIVTPSDRAADNKTAMSLLQPDQMVNMEADGNLTKDKFCIVTSKNDLLDWEAYVEAEVSPEHISETFPKLFDDLLDAEERLETLSEDSVVDDEDEHEQEILSTPTSGKRALMQAQSNQVEARRRFLSKRKELEMEIQDLKTQCYRACLDHRNNANRVSLQEQFNKARSALHAGQPPSSTELSVFPVTSKSHLRLVKGRPTAAFPDAHTTGIQALNDWIIQSSFQTRLDKTQVLLSQIQVLFDEVNSWILDGCQISAKLAGTKLPSLELVIKDIGCHYKKTMTSRDERFHENIISVHSGLMVERAKIDGKISQEFVRHVENYRKDNAGIAIHPLSYAACVRRTGGRHIPRKHEPIEWLSRLFTFYWSPIVGKWHAATQKTLPSHLNQFKTAQENDLNWYIQQVLHKDSLPGVYKDMFRERSDRLHNLLTEHLDKITLAYNRYSDRVSEIKRDSQDTLKTQMLPTFYQAQYLHGPGSCRMKMSTIEEGAEQIKASIFSSTTSDIEKKLKDAQQEFYRDHCRLTRMFLESVLKVALTLARQICQSPSQFDPASGRREALKNIMTARLPSWQRRWTQLKAGATSGSRQLQGIDMLDQITVKAEDEFFIKTEPE
ncbi:hypothetical protein B0I35DRAFT_440210 [Stachybotrys elegans]|uniref:Uncharacterized protein n=1 Tax=Stachybotrys elegans TaxID=80388 RepID=A0A8K0SJ49_9HYPO|nr:hypothetical protein B0I35DRAFT_440210 [Stachybotrys elegans]